MKTLPQEALRNGKRAPEDSYLMSGRIRVERRTDGKEVPPFALKADFAAARAALFSDNELPSTVERPSRANGFRGTEGAPQASPNGQRQRAGWSAALRPEAGSSGSGSPRGTASGGIAAALREAVKRRTTGSVSTNETVLREFANGDSYSGQWKLDLVSRCLPLGRLFFDRL